MSIQFKLNRGVKTTDKNKEYPIYIRYNLGRKVDFSASIGFKLKPDDWNSEKEEARDKAHISNKQQINTKIKLLRRHFEDFDNENNAKGIIPSRNQVKAHYNAYYTSPETKETTLLGYWQEFIDRSTNSAGTIKTYKTALKVMQDFNNDVYPVDFEDITMQFYDDLKKYGIKRGFSVNYFGKLVTKLKTVLNDAVKYKVCTNTEFRGFAVLKEEVDNIYLTPDELNKLYHLPLEEGSYRDRVRDIFLIGAWTGLRVSDYNHLTKENFLEENGEKYITVRPQKTRNKSFKKVVVPIHPIVDAILRKNNYSAPKKVKEQKLNEYIKELCLNAGIDDSVIIHKRRLDGKEYSKKYQKCDLVESHTARRSFATNAYLAGDIDTLDIMSLTGHTTQKNFLRYIKADELQKARKISQSSFFKGPSLKVV